MKPGPVAAMVALLFIGAWLVLGPQIARRTSETPGAPSFEWIVGTSKIEVEMRPSGAGDGYEYRFLNWPEQGDGWLDSATFERVLAAEAEMWEERHVLLKLFNASGWTSVVWVFVGLGGQMCFFGRMLTQWIISEQRSESVVPPLFWWLSLFGGAGLFVYFVWRVDLVGVLGQSTGVVIYARNLRLIHKQRRRSQR